MLSKTQFIESYLTAAERNSLRVVEKDAHADYQAYMTADDLILGQTQLYFYKDADGKLSWVVRPA